MNEQLPQRILDDAELSAIATRRALALREIAMICSGEKRWRMSIPVYEQDSDEIFDAVLNDIDAMMKEVYRLRGALKLLYIEHPEFPTEVQSFIHNALFGTLAASVAAVESEASDG